MDDRFADADPTGDWSAAACRTVADALTASLDLGGHRPAVVETLVWMHFLAAELGERVHGWTGREYHGSPQHLLAVLHAFRDVLTEQREQIEDAQRFRLVGLDKLRTTVEQVEQLQASLSTKRTRLEAANAEANDRLQRMVAGQQAAEKKREASLALQADLAAKEAAVAQRRAGVLADLEAAEPAVLDAQAAVSNIKKQHLSEVRSMANPPAPVKLTMESVCMLLGHRLDGWKSVQSLIRRDDFIASVVRLDTNAVPRTLRERLQHEYLSRPEYNYDTINHASTACGPLARWVLAQVHYADILERVAPLRAEVAALEAQAAATREDAARADATVGELEASIDAYKREYAGLISETQALEAEMQRVSARVERSVRLLGGLAAERTRWEAGRETFDAQVGTLVGDALLCAAMIAFAGFFDQACREALWRAWCARLDAVDIPVRRHLAFAEVLASADEHAAWYSAGLPRDALSTDNAVVLQRCTRVPFVIDPSARTTPFLAALYAPAEPAVTSFLDGGFVQVLERALRFGTPVVITDAEFLDPVVLPVLSGEKRRTGGRTLVRLGKTDVDWAPAFRLVLATRHAGVTLPPHVFARVQVVNFTVTRKSLQAQSLERVLRAERPEVEAQRADLLQMQGEFARRLLRLERALLAALNDAGNILDDDRVVSTLETLKAEADDVTQKASRTEEIMAHVHAATAAYDALADACSAIYFLLEQLRGLHRWYDWDLSFFEELLTGVLSAEKGAQDRSETDAAARRSALYRELFLATFRHAAPALLQADHLVLALALAQVYCRAGPRAGALDTTDYAALVGSASDAPTLRLVAHERVAHPEAWAPWDAATSPETTPLPLAPLESMDALVRQALVVKAHRPDRLGPALVRLVHGIFDCALLDAPPLGVADVRAPSTTPRVLCGVAGYDASSHVEHLVSQTHTPCAQVALGSPEALAGADAALAGAARTGTWVLLKNAHLAPAWLAQLPTRLEALAPHADMRAFVTCELSPSVPAAFVRAARVVMHEPPAGLRAALLDALHAARTRAAPAGPPERERVYFLVALLHALVLERTRHAPLGWSHAYDFYDTDLEAALALVDTCVADAARGRPHLAPEHVPWAALRTLLAQTVYGGKMDSATDRRMLDALVDQLLTAAACEPDHPLVPDAQAPLLAPDGVRLADFVAWADALPEPQPPHWLLLAPAAERATAAARGSAVLARLAELRILSERDESLGDLGSAAEAHEPPEVGTLLAHCLDMVPRVADHHVAKEPMADDALARFWARERRMAADVAARVRADLEHAAAVAAHTTPRTNEAAVILADIARGAVPGAWRLFASAATELHTWLTDMQQRVAQATSDAPTVSLGALFHPAAFLTATRQAAARARRTSLEQLRVELRLGAAPAAPGEYALGPLWIDGATWNGALSLNDGAATCVSQSALVWTDAPPAGVPHVALPVFVHGNRQQQLFTAQVPTERGFSTPLAVLRAVALRAS